MTFLMAYSPSYGWIRCSQGDSQICEIHSFRSTVVLSIHSHVIYAFLRMLFMYLWIEAVLPRRNCPDARFRRTAPLLRCTMKSYALRFEPSLSCAAILRTAWPAGF